MIRDMQDTFAEGRTPGDDRIKNHATLFHLKNKEKILKSSDFRIFLCEGRIHTYGLRVMRCENGNF